jgi:acetyl-CoA C-acetyltransferase
MPDPRPVYLLPGLRSPFSRIDRELSRFDSLRLSVPVLQQTVAGPKGTGLERSGEVDLILWGAVIPNLRVSNWAREVWLDAGLDPHVPAQSVVQQCATSLAAATQAATSIRAGQGELALCGGVDSMSNTQIGLSDGLSRAIRRAGSARGAAAVLRQVRSVHLKDVRLAIPAVKERATGKSMGEHAEEMAKEWEIPRADQDRYAVTSHLKAVEAAGRGFFRPLLVSPGTFGADVDTLPRPGTSEQALSVLRPVFDRNRGTLTAGNSSPLTDGAAACWVAAATQRLLERHDLRYGDIDLWEIHEAFAAQVLCTIEALENRRWVRDNSGVETDLGAFPRDRINPNGGSIAIGHPFGATGARILSQCAAELAGRPTGSRAVVSVCAAGGLGHVALLASI